MGEIKVAIYERVKRDDKWTRVRVEVPNGRRRDGRLLLKDDHQGKFELSWYEKRIKQWQRVTNPNDEEQLPLLSHALKQADDKSWFLNNRHRNVTDPTTTADARKKLAGEIPSYLEAKSGCKKTVSAHRLALTEFQGWATQQKEGRGIRFVDEITKSLLRKFFNYLVDGDEENDGPENTPFPLPPFNIDGDLTRAFSTSTSCEGLFPFGNSQVFIEIFYTPLCPSTARMAI